jgi:hypothetical protein
VNANSSERSRVHAVRSVKRTKTRRARVAKVSRTSPAVSVALGDMRRHLLVALSATSITIAALMAQSADVGRDAALVLRRCVGDELEHQIEQIGGLLARGEP